MNQLRDIQLTGDEKLPVSWPLWGISLLLALAGLGLSTVLFLDSANAGGGLGCTGELIDCQSVLNSSFARVLGVPVSVPAIGVYASVLGCLLFTLPIVEASVQLLAWRILAALAAAAAIAAVWFTGLQMFYLEKFCVYCLATHACSIGLAAVILWQVVLHDDWQVSLLGAPWVGAVSATALIAAQIVLTPELPGMLVVDNQGMNLDLTNDGSLLDDDPTLALNGHDDKEPSKDPDPVTDIGALTDPGSVEVLRPVTQEADGESADPATPNSYDRKSREYTALSGQLKISAQQYPLVGNPQADAVVIKLFDYTCHHCRDLHEQIHAVQDKLNGDLAVFLVPVPLCADCNSNLVGTVQNHLEACNYARLAMVVWDADPEAFERFHNYMMAGEHEPPYAAAKAFAAELIGSETLEQGLSQARLARRIQMGPSLHASVQELISDDKRRGLPQIIMDDKILSREFTDNGEALSVLGQYVRDQRK